MRTLVSCALLVAGLAAQPNLRPGTDVSLSTLGSLGSPTSAHIGTYPNGSQSWGVSTTSCNVGTVNVPWIRDMNIDHPQMGMWMYRDYNGRFEQITLFKGVKHGFTSTNSPGCGNCPGGAGTSLVIGCTDTYSASLNYSHTYMAPPSEINPWTGVWTSVGSHFDRGFPEVPPPQNTDNIRSPITFTNPNQGYRNMVWDAKLNTPGATYWVTGYYVVLGEPEANRINNYATRQFTASWSGAQWSWANPNATQYQNPGLFRWSGALLNSSLNNNGDDGRLYVAVKVTGPTAGVYHYEYVVWNRDNNRQAGTFSIPVCATAAVTNLYIGDPDDDPTNNWTMNRTGSALVFTAPAANANNITWGNMFNFAFDADASPANANVTIGQALPGPGSATVDVASRAPLDMRNLSLGSGCGIPSAPLLGANGPASLGNAAFALQLGNVAAGAGTWFVLSAQSTNLNLGGGCTLFVDPAQLFFVGNATANGSGVASLGIPIPNDINLDQATFIVQGAEAQTGGAYAAMLDLSGGLKVKIGSGNPGCN